MRKLIIAYITIVVIAVTITGLLILAKNGLNAQTNTSNTVDSPSNVAKQVLYEEYHLPIKDGTKGAELNQKINLNPINISKEVYEDDKVICSYLVIDGLKNKEVQKEINETLKNELIDYGNWLYKQILDFDVKYKNKKDNEYLYSSMCKYIDGKAYYFSSDEYQNATNWKVFVSQGVLANFSNVLSVKMDQEDQLLDYSLNSRFLNFRLADGSRLGVESLFTENISAKEIFGKNVYKRLGKGEITYKEYETYEYDGTSYTYGIGNGFYSEVDVSKQEKLVKQFAHTKDINFGFTDCTFTISLGDYSVNQSLSKYATDVAIFNRYLGDNEIYDGKYDAIKGLPAFCGIATGDNLIYGRTFDRIGNVVLLYYVSYMGSYDEYAKDKEEVKFGLDKINSQIMDDVNKLNDTYVGNGLILYSGSFKIDVYKYNDEELNPQLSQFFDKNKGYISLEFNPNVQEISKDDMEILMSDSNYIYYSKYYFSIENYRYYTDDDNEYHSEEVFSLKDYIPYKKNIRPEYYTENHYTWSDSDEVYYNYIREAYYLIGDNYREVNSKDELMKYLVNLDDLPAIAQIVFDTMKNKENYPNITIDNYSYDFYNNLEIIFKYYTRSEYYEGWSDRYEYVNFLRESGRYDISDRNANIAVYYF